MKATIKSALIALGLILMWAPLPSQSAEEASLLTVKEVMNAIITPMSTIIWGAYQLETEAQWSAVENAALTLIGAGELLASGGAGESETAMAAQENWQTYNNQMIAAARKVIAAVAEKNEEALSEAGNSDLYPPCEQCHQQYQTR